MFCSNCGKQINDGSKFCEYCGFQITQQAPQQPMQQQYPQYQQPVQQPQQTFTYGYPAAGYAAQEAAGKKAKKSKVGVSAKPRVRFLGIPVSPKAGIIILALLVAAAAILYFTGVIGGDDDSDEPSRSRRRSENTTVSSAVSEPAEAQSTTETTAPPETTTVPPETTTQAPKETAKKKKEKDFSKIKVGTPKLKDFKWYKGPSQTTVKKSKKIKNLGKIEGSWKVYGMIPKGSKELAKLKISTGQHNVTVKITATKINYGKKWEKSKNSAKYKCKFKKGVLTSKKKRLSLKIYGFCQRKNKQYGFAKVKFKDGTVAYWALVRP